MVCLIHDCFRAHNSKRPPVGGLNCEKSGKTVLTRRTSLPRQCFGSLPKSEKSFFWGGGGGIPDGYAKMLK